MNNSSKRKINVDHIIEYKNSKTTKDIYQINTDGNVFNQCTLDVNELMELYTKIASFIIVRAGDLNE